MANIIRFAFVLFLAGCGGPAFTGGEASGGGAEEPTDSAPAEVIPAGTGGAPALAEATGGVGGLMVGTGGVDQATGGLRADTEAGTGGLDQGTGGTASSTGGVPVIGTGGVTNGTGGAPALPPNCGKPGHAGVPSASDPSCNASTCSEGDAACKATVRGCQWLDANTADCSGLQAPDGTGLDRMWLCPADVGSLPTCRAPLASTMAAQGEFCCPLSAAPVTP